MAQMLRIRMLGKLSLTYGDKQISVDSNRARAVWNLLAYVIYNRPRIVFADELYALLKTEEKGSVNPAGTLKTAMFRARGMLDMLGEGMGRRLLRSENGGYAFSPDIETEVDREKFDSLLEKSLKGDGEPELSSLLEALVLYNGNFCNMQSSETWVMPISVYYQNKFSEAVQLAIPLLEKNGRHGEIVDVCRKALETDPYSEGYYQQLMRALLSLGKRAEVVTVYEDMSKLLLSTFGVMPDRESRALYREALRTVNLNTVSPEALFENLREELPVSGALICDYDFFKNVYQAQARMIARSGNAVHVALLTASGRLGKEPAKKSVEMAMDNLEKHLARSLRKGDVITRCSSSQFAIMLPMANYENSCAVCDRVIGSFMKQYPHTPVRIDCFVKALEPITVD